MDDHSTSLLRKLAEMTQQVESLRASVLAAARHVDGPTTGTQGYYPPGVGPGTPPPLPPGPTPPPPGGSFYCKACGAYNGP